MVYIPMAGALAPVYKPAAIMTAGIIIGGSGDLVVDRRFDYAQALAARGDFGAAADLLEQAIVMFPGWPPLSFHLGECLRQAGREKEAVAAFERYLDLDPQDHMGASVKLTILGAAPVPDSLPEPYVRSLFDDYAARFDQALIETLDYKTPWQIRDLLLKTEPERRYPALLDLGCGTGLAAEAIKGSFDVAVGVDLSQGMIFEAEQKAIYAELHVDSLEHFLSENTRTYDLVISADVLVYIGALEEVIAGMARAALPGGLVAFSVQRLEEGDFILGADHRFSHSLAYIRSCLDKAGLELRAFEEGRLRKDGDRDIIGFTVLAAPCSV